MNLQALASVLVALPIILLVPGYFTLVAFVKVRQRELDWTFPEAMMIVVAISVFIVSLFALLLAELGVFSIYLVLLGICAYLITLSVVFRGFLWKDALHFTGMPRPRVGVELAGVVFVTLLAIALFVQPFDYVIGGLDSGTYANTGIDIAETGSIIVHDPAAVGLSPAEAELFFGRTGRPWVVGSRLVGFYLKDLETGSVQPQGFHLFPVWIAILYSLGGVKAGLLATPLFALLGVLSLYFLGKRLFGTHVGVLAAFLLTICVGQIWFARVPLSEMAVQFFMLAGIYLFTLSVDCRSRFFAALAGVSLGMVHLAKIEIILLPFSVLGFLLFALAVRKFRREYWYLLGGYLVILVYAILHAAFVANVYAVEVINNTWLPMINGLAPGSVELIRKVLWGESFTANDVIRIAELVAAVLTLGFFGWIAARVLVPRASILSTGAKEVTRLGLFACVAGLAVYGWFVRPAFTRIDPGLSQMAIATQVNNAQSLIRLGWYISPFGVLLGLAGLAKGIIDELNSKVLFFLVIAVPTSVLLLFNSFITPVHFWAGRRFVYIVIPGFLLLAAYALHSLRKGKDIDWKSDIIPTSIAVALMLTLIRPAVPFLRHVEYAGAPAQLGELAAALPDNSVVLFEASLESNMFSVPLKYLYKKDVRVLGKEALSDARLSGMLKRWESEGRRVLWVGVSKEFGSLPSAFALRYLGTKSISLPEADVTTDNLPYKPHPFSTTLSVYEFAPSSTNQSQNRPDSRAPG